MARVRHAAKSRDRKVYLFPLCFPVFLLVLALILILVNIKRLQRQLGEELHGAEILAASVVILQFLQFILHNLRFRRRSHWLLQWGAWAAYYVPMPLAASAVGMMLRLRRPFWPVAVLFAAGQSDTMAAYSVDDDSQNMRRFARRTLYLAYLVVALLQLLQQGVSTHVELLDGYYSLFAGFLVFLVRLKVSSMATVSSGDICTAAAEAASSRRRSSASTSNLGGQQKGDLLGLRQEKGELLGSVVALGPLESCPSAIAGSTTYEDILAVEYSDKLQDVCLSSALFLQLLQRHHGPHQRVDASSANSAFRKLVLPEGGRDSSASRSRKLLLAEGDHARALKLVEVQLSLMYDHFFSAHGSPSSASYKLYWHHWVFKIGFLMHILSLVYVYPKSHSNAPPPPQQQEPHHGCGAFAIGVVYLLVMLDLCRLVHYFTSDRFIVSYMCDRPRRTSSRSTCNKPPQHMVVLNAIFETRGNWQITLGQYSLIEDYSGCNTTSLGQSFMGRRLHHSSSKKRRLHRHELRPQRGNPASPPVPLSVDQVKAWIIERVFFEPSSAPSSPLRWKDDFPEKLSWAFRKETETHTILTWHIATWICSMGTVHSSADQMAATKLSSYCTYLVAFCPELLPGHHAVASRIFDEAIREAELHLVGETTPYGRYTRIIQVWEQRKLSSDHPRGVLERGAKLAQHLKDIENEHDSRYCWAIIADFWAEMMLHLALSGNPTAHIEHLAKGGEFVTRLWALLSNAGIQQNTTLSLAEPKKVDSNEAQGKQASNRARSSNRAGCSRNLATPSRSMHGATPKTPPQIGICASLK